MCRLIENGHKLWTRLSALNLRRAGLRWCHSITHEPGTDQWMATLDKETRQEVEQIRSLVEKQAKLHTSSVTVELNATKYKFLLGSTSNGRKKSIRNLLNLEDVRKERQSVHNIRKASWERIQSEKIANTDNQHIQYGLGRNALFNRLDKRSLRSWHRLKLARAVYTKEPQIIYDCSFNHTMSPYELQSAARQLKYSIEANYLHSQPFRVHLCNVPPESPLRQLLHKQVSWLDTLPICMHDHDIGQVFEPQRLVYLTPNSEHILEEYNPLDCYVVGCIVDRGPKPPLTLTKATELNIRTARLPIDKYVTFCSPKTLTLDQVTRILLAARSSTDWQRDIIRHIPDFKYL